MLKQEKAQMGLTTLMMAAFHLGEPDPEPGGIERTHSLTLCFGTLNKIELWLMLVTAVLFLLRQVKMSAVKQVSVLQLSIDTI